MSSPATSPTSSAELVDNLLSELVFKASHLQLGNHEAVELIGEEDWNALQPVLRESERSTRLKRVRQILEEKVRKKLISDWVENNVSGSSYEKFTLKAEIESCIKEDREEDLREYLPTVLDLGATKAFKTIKHKKKWGSGGYGGYIWEAIVGIVRLIIVIGIFTVAQSKFETIVFAMLVMSYYAVYRTSQGGFQSRTAMAFGIDNQFRRVRRLLKEELSTDERAMQYEAEKEIQKEAKRNTVRFWIQMFSFSLIWLVAMWKIITAVFF